jgi:hypothetical protein
VTTPASTPSSAQPGGRVQLALAPALRLRLLGTGLVAIGVVVALAGLLTWSAGLPTALLAGLVVLAGVGVLALVGLLGVRHWVVRLDDEGYRVRALRSAQARSARWTDVLDLQTARISGQRCAVLRLRDGRTTALPVEVIEGDSSRLTELLTAHLDRGHGYKRLR